MKWLKQLVLIAISMLMMTSCIEEDHFEDTPRGNFEALWKIIDEHYCFFEEKNIDWQEVHQRYSQQITSDMNERTLFQVLTNMLAELKDGHVNVYTGFDLGRYWSWQENYPKNINDSIIRKYLGTDYLISAGMRYKILDDNIGYLRCTSFSNTPGSNNLDNILAYFLPCNGLIIDLRNNPGGLVTSAQTLASRFINERKLVGYIQHKTGKGHRDFSPLEEQYLEPGKGLRWQKQTVVLTNRSVFSAGNEFVKYMKQFPHVTIIGDNTGGGAGLPFSSELPNGWSIRFSGAPIYDENKKSTEFGIAPDIDVSLKEEDILNGKDTMIEFARRYLYETMNAKKENKILFHL